MAAGVGLTAGLSIAEAPLHRPSAADLRSPPRAPLVDRLLGPPATAGARP